MKTRNILAIIFLAVFAAILMVSMSANVTQFTGFEMAKAEGKSVKIAGLWVKKELANYDVGRECFSFYLQDSLGKEQLVEYYDPMPANFDKAHKVVVTGKYDGKRDVFVASEILTKCPSKYNNDAIESPEGNKPNQNL